MIYGRAFFDLQIDFAEVVAALAELPLARAVLDYTNCYIRFGFGRDFDPAHPGWRDYLAGLAEASDRRDWTYRFYLAQRAEPAGPPVVASFGCFAYAGSSAERIRLHFENVELDGRSPLSPERREQRMAELTALFEHLERTAPPSTRVAGASWLYNLEAYRRLFPKSYVATARPLAGRFRHMPLWGQFVDRHGELNERAARQLLERVERQSSLDGLDACFPLPVLAVEASVDEFYGFYRGSCPV